MKDLNIIISDLEAAKADIDRQIKLFRRLEAEGGTLSKQVLEWTAMPTLSVASVDSAIFNARCYNIGVLRDAGFANKYVAYRFGHMPSRISQIYAVYKRTNNK